jgi:hypothetical protein
VSRSVAAPYRRKELEPKIKGMTQLLYVTGLFMALLLPACSKIGIGFTKIGDIVAKPEKFSTQEVSIRGKVTNALKVPFVATKIYTVQDDSGEINIRTVREVPMVGSEVRVKGVLDTVAIIGEQNVGLHLREIERW